ncbi:caspase family protein [Ideonella sp.]|uniref:caspase family protein n=1 Tax=Ideonella sp. TaxID=1929293 RepID=UPI003BB5E6EC
MSNNAHRAFTAFGSFVLLLLAAATAHATDRALLVGVGEYPLLADKRLEGPANDLRLMTGMLTRMGWRPEQIKVLSDAGGAAHWPTRDHIMAGLDELALQAKNGDWVVVYFSGHGSQVPQSTKHKARWREPDGLDEVFLPRDTSAWDPAKRIVVGAITDDEFSAALNRITAKGAQVWAIFDTCHAGDMLRGVQATQSNEPPIWRYISPQELKVPAEALAQPWRTPYVARTTTQRWVGFLASQADEGAAEESLPDPDQPTRKQRFGVFTHLLHQSTVDWRGSFSELAARLKRGYQERPFPTPDFQGRLSAVPRFVTNTPTSLSRSAKP